MPDWDGEDYEDIEPNYDHGVVDVDAFFVSDQWQRKHKRR